MDKIHYEVVRRLCDEAPARIEDMRERAGIILGANSIVIALVGVIVENLLRVCVGLFLVVECILILPGLWMLSAGAYYAFKIIRCGRVSALLVVKNVRELRQLQYEDILRHYLSAALLMLKKAEELSSFLRRSVLFSILGLLLLTSATSVGIIAAVIPPNVVNAVGF